MLDSFFHVCDGYPFSYIQSRDPQRESVAIDSHNDDDDGQSLEVSSPDAPLRDDLQPGQLHKPEVLDVE